VYFEHQFYIRCFGKVNIISLCTQESVTTALEIQITVLYSVQFLSAEWDVREQ